MSWQPQSVNEFGNSMKYVYGVIWRKAQCSAYVYQVFHSNWLKRQKERYYGDIAPSTGDIIVNRKNTGKEPLRLLRRPLKIV